MTQPSQPLSISPTEPMLKLDHEFMKGLTSSEIIAYAKQQLGLDLGSRVIVLASVNEDETAHLNGEIIAFSVRNEAPYGWEPTVSITVQLDGSDMVHEDNFDGFIPLPGPGQTHIQ